VIYLVKACYLILFDDHIIMWRVDRDAECEYN